jgi:hypothetical protein
MGQERLCSSLATLQIEKMNNIYLDQVINEFDSGTVERGRNLNLK